MQKNPVVSIIIPTLLDSENRFNGLERLLESLHNQKNVDIPFEIIIVDNGNGAGFNQSLKCRHSNIKIIKEPDTGLSKARNVGITHCIGTIIAFLDDDIIPSEIWLSSLLQAHKKISSLCVGGPVFLSSHNINMTFPGWFSDYFLRFIIPPSFPKAEGIIKEPFFIIGANMSFKCATFSRFGFFDMNLGRKGNNLLSGEDIEFILRLNKEDVYFEPNAKVFTEINSERLTRLFFLRRIFWQAVSDAKIVKKHGLSKTYDRVELSLSSNFFRNLSNLAGQGLYFSILCTIIRICVFRICLIPSKK